LATSVGTVRLRNPVMAASGTAGHGAELGAYVDLASLGGVVVKSLSAQPWAGNPPPRLHGAGPGMLNAVGLQGPGVAAWVEHDLPTLLRAGATVVASIWGRTIEEYGEAAALLAGVPGITAVEVNLSCPNLEGGRHLFAHDPTATGAAVEAVAACGRPRWAKLSPNTDRLVEVAAAAGDAGAEAVVVANTVLGMVLDLERFGPVLGNGGGGLSGPAIHAIAVRAVWDLHTAHPDIPIVGVGGVRDAATAVELLQAGASAVEVGTATLADPRATAKVLAGLDRWLAGHDIKAAALVGRAHG
ncbi:MAG: dihydroorotate dehydrogenase, partial [Acidimicrobiales bacterium]